MGNHYVFQEFISSDVGTVGPTLNFHFHSGRRPADTDVELLPNETVVSHIGSNDYALIYFIRYVCLCGAYGQPDNAHRPYLTIFVNVTCYIYNFTISKQHNFNHHLTALKYYNVIVRRLSDVKTRTRKLCSKMKCQQMKVFSM